MDFGDYKCRIQQAKERLPLPKPIVLQGDTIEPWPELAGALKASPPLVPEDAHDAESQVPVLFPSAQLRQQDATPTAQPSEEREQA